MTPDRANFDATPAMGWDGKPVQFSYDSWRSVSNWSVDYSWWKKSEDEPTLSERYQKFLVGQGIHTFVDRYSLDGKPMSERHSTGNGRDGSSGESGSEEGRRMRARSSMSCGIRRCRRANSAITTAALPDEHDALQWRVSDLGTEISSDCERITAGALWERPSYFRLSRVKESAGTVEQHRCRRWDR